MNYYERHIGDYLKDTAHLSLLEHGIYGRLLDIYYGRESGIPDDQVARLVGAKTKEEIGALQRVLGEFFALVGQIWLQSRCEGEIARYKDKQRKAKASADARWSHTERNANAMRTHSEGNAPSSQTPVTKEKEKARVPALSVLELVAEGVDAQIAGEWLAVRAVKRLRLTPLAWSGIKAEFSKAGLSVPLGVAKCVTRGWAAFDATWVMDAKQKAADVVRVTVADNPALDETAAWLKAEEEHRAAIKAERERRQAA